AEIDRQALLTHHVVDAADTVKDPVLGGAHDFQVKVAVLPGDVEPAIQPLLRCLEDGVQPLEILLGRAAAGECGRLDLANFPDVDGFVDLHRIERQSCPGKQRHRLDARLGRVHIDAGLGTPLDDAHRLQDRQRLANLAAADRKMLSQFPFRGRAAGPAVRMREEVGGQFRQKVVFFHDQPWCACASRNRSEMVKPRPGASGIATIPSLASTVSSMRSWINGFAPSAYSMTKLAGEAAHTCRPAKKQGAPAHKCGAKRRLKALAIAPMRIASVMPPQKAGSGWNTSAAFSTARSR